MKEKKPTSGVYPQDSNDAVERRETVKRLLGGAGVATAVTMWSKPIVESVILPAHAQTSPAPPTRTTPPPPTRTTPPPPDDPTPPTSFSPPPTSDDFSPPPGSYHYYDPWEYYKEGFEDYEYFSPPPPPSYGGSDFYSELYDVPPPP